MNNKILIVASSYYKEISSNLIEGAINYIVEKNFEYVGNNLAKKVREAYYDKKNKKNIYGTTTSKERDELLEEGIEITSIPWVEKDN